MDTLSRRRLVATFFDRYPKFREQFNPNAPDTITVVVISDTGAPGPGSSTRARIDLYSGYLRYHPEQLQETFCHELMHQVLLYHNNVEKWLIEGIADYGNYYYGATSLAWRSDSFNHTPRSDVYWYSGYQHTAKFLIWLDTQYPGFTRSLHKACLSGTYKKQTYFADHTNKTIEQLWTLYSKNNTHRIASD
ncbi:basic secretory protein-like protein [Niabella sp.]|uniref:basic secretory protein-like protein n=1 Tax=Niabella sp. TaxID=1962976 RepID=UPI00262C1003|nr:basic secretory protein-like protein [Niabella sp.]